MPLKKVISSKLSLDHLKLQCPLVITYYRKGWGVYIPCGFDDDGEPDWAKIISVAQEYLEKGNES